MVKVKNEIVLIVKGTFCVIVVSLFLTYIRMYLQIKVTSSTSNINSGIDTNIIKILMPLFFSPIIEEHIFRKWIPNVFQEVIGRIPIVILSNILFSLFHFDAYFLPYLANGLIYAWYYEKTKDIKIPIFIHISFNFFVFIVTYL